MAAIYDDLEFKTALEARWAAFFDLAGWDWWYNPAPFEDWTPDFRVKFPCGHSECGSFHTLLVAVVNASVLTTLKGHPALAHTYRIKVADAGALFGSNPSVTTWEMAHGSGSGLEDVVNWVPDAHDLWRKAGSLIRT